MRLATASVFVPPQTVQVYVLMPAASVVGAFVTVPASRNAQLFQHAHCCWRRHGNATMHLYRPRIRTGVPARRSSFESGRALPCRPSSKRPNHSCRRSYMSPPLCSPSLPLGYMAKLRDHMVFSAQFSSSHTVQDTTSSYPASSSHVASFSFFLVPSPGVCAGPAFIFLVSTCAGSREQTLVRIPSLYSGCLPRDNRPFPILTDHSIATVTVSRLNSLLHLEQYTTVS